MCEESRTARLVAIKVVRCIRKYTEGARIEADILDEVNRADPGRRSLTVRYYSSFEHKGHFCMVFEPLGPSLYDYVKANGFKAPPLYCVQAFADQLITSVAYLHELSIIHTDLKLENILLVSREPYGRTDKSNSTRKPGRLLAPTETDIRCAYSRAWRCACACGLYGGFVEGRPAQTLGRNPFRRPGNLPPTRSLAHSCHPPHSHPAVIDFGGATYDSDYKSSLINTRQYRSPEVILGLGWSFPSDMWSVGCILMELYSGALLFQTVSGRTAWQRCPRRVHQGLWGAWRNHRDTTTTAPYTHPVTTVPPLHSTPFYHYRAARQR